MTQRKRMNRKRGGTTLARVASLASAFRNHPQWYEAYPLEHLMGINFGQREKLGVTIPGPYLEQTGPVRQTDIESAPDMAISLDLVVPAGTTAFRESMQILMNKLRAASGSNITYTVNDLGAYVLNARELYALYSMARKIILETRITDIYDQDAHFKYAVAATGRAATTLADITTNLASDTTRLNRLAGVISSMIPIRMNLMERTAWLFSNIFADSKTAKFSTKQFISTYSKKWNADNINDLIETSDWSATPLTLTGLIDRLEDLVGYFTGITENSRIAGDLMKAFGAFFTQLSPIDETTRIVPIYDEAALTQIQNCTVVPQPDVSNYTPDIEIRSTGAVIAWYTASPSTHVVQTMFNSYSGRDKILNSYKDSLTPGEIVSLTRLTAASDVVERTGPTPPAGNYCTVSSCGTEVVTNIRYFVGSNANGSLNSINYSPVFASPAMLGSNLMEISNVAAQLMECWARDDWAPMIAPFFIGTQLQYPLKACTMYDLSNWASIDLNNLDVFHQAACLSLTATPSSIVEQSSFRFLK